MSRDGNTKHDNKKDFFTSVAWFLRVEGRLCSGPPHQPHFGVVWNVLFGDTYVQFNELFFEGEDELGLCIIPHRKMPSRKAQGVEAPVWKVQSYDCPF